MLSVHQIKDYYPDARTGSTSQEDPTERLRLPKRQLKSSFLTLPHDGCREDVQRQIPCHSNYSDLKLWTDDMVSV